MAPHHPPNSSRSSEDLSGNFSGDLPGRLAEKKTHRKTGLHRSAVWLGLEHSGWGLRALLLGDALFFVLHGLHFITPALPEPLFSISSDVSLPEIYQGLKLLGMVGLLIQMGWQSRELRFGSWVLLLVYLICDDLTLIHEGQGDGIADWMDSQRIVPPFGLRSQDYGELIIILGSAICFLGLIALCYRQGRNPLHPLQRRRLRLFRQTTGSLIRFLVLLGLFGVGMDLLHGALAFNRLLHHLLDFLEDGGEMVVISLMTSYVAIAAEKTVKNRAYFR